MALQNIKKVYKRQMLNELLEDDGEHGVVEILKSIKKVIYMIAESWDQGAESVTSFKAEKYRGLLKIKILN